jgi:cardiolipin synthase
MKNETKILQENLAYLKLAWIRDHHSEDATTAAEKHRSHSDYLIRLIEGETLQRRTRAIETFFTSITLAKKQILAVTPYFVPPADVLRALQSAALRGLDVCLIVPQKNNHFYTGLASRALYEELLLAGVKIFERHPPFMHAKALVIDGEFALVGTANIDERSLNLNYESSVAIYSEPFADALKNIIHEDIVLSVEVLLTQWQHRPAHRRLLENLAALMTPVL